MQNTAHENKSIDAIDRRIQFFLDTSGSTTGERAYYERAKKEFEKVVSTGAQVEFFEWATKCMALNYDDMMKAFKYRMSVNSECGCGTELLQVIDHISDKSSTVVIVTDGEIRESDFTSATRLLKNKLAAIANERGAEPKIRLIVQGKVDMSCVLALGSVSRDFEFEINDEPAVKAVRSNGKTDDDIVSYVDSIDLKSYIQDIEYKRKTDLSLRFYTVDQPDADFIHRLLNILKQKSHAGSNSIQIDTRAIESALKNSENDLALSLLRDELNKHDTVEVERIQIDRAVAQLSTIINNYRDRTTLYFDQDKTFYEVPETTVYDDDGNDEADKKQPPGTIECFFTSQVGVPYVSFTLDESLKVNKSMLDQLVTNPLAILSVCKLDTAFGSFFVNHPSQFADGRDPRTRKPLFDADSTALVLALGTEPEHIYYTDKVLRRVLFNNYKVLDLDLVFLAIWYQIKYKSARDDLKEAISCFEEQLKARFDKISPLSLNSSVYECSKLRAKKWIAIWFIVHELAYFKQENQNHSSTIRFLPHMHILIAFLQDIYNIKVQPDLQHYLKDYLMLVQLIRLQNTSDKAEFWRRIRALKTTSLSIDQSASIVKLGADLHVTKLVGEIAFGEGVARVATVEQNRRATIVTIPLDEPREMDGAGEPNVPDELLEFFSAGRGFCSRAAKRFFVSNLGNLSLHMFNPRETLLMFNDDAANQAAQKRGAQTIGFDPRFFEPVWGVHPRPTFVQINPYTLRPPLMPQDNLWTVQAQKELGEGQKFVSFHALLGEFICTYRKIPTISEMILFVYKCESQKTREVVLINNELISRPRNPNSIFTLQNDIDFWGLAILENFKKVVADRGYTIEEVIRRFKASKRRGDRLDMEKEGRKLDEQADTEAEIKQTQPLQIDDHALRALLEFRNVVRRAP